MADISFRIVRTWKILRITLEAYLRQQNGLNS